MFLPEDHILLNEYRVLTRIFTFFCVLPLVFLLFRKWMEGQKFTHKINGEGKVAIITGADTNIGRETSLGLARYGMQVIMACSSLDEGEQIRQNIITKTGNDQIKCVELDLRSFDSIRMFVDKFKTTESRLDYLIHANTDIRSTQCLADGKYQFTVGCYFYGQFLLSFLLRSILQESRPSRIVFISSWLHRFYANGCLRVLGASDFCQNSIATILGAKGMSNCLLNSGVTCNVVDPGPSVDDLEMMVDCLKSIPRSIKEQLNNLLLLSAQTRSNAVLKMVLDFSLQNISGTYYAGNYFSIPYFIANDDEVADSVLKHIEQVVETRISNKS